MNIDKKTIHKVADLAHIAVKEEEVDELIVEMSKILTFMEQLNELDTEGVEPLVYLNPDVNVFREDVVKQEITIEQGLMNASKHNEAFFMVPKIIEK
ncbi:aspartyl-tRNA(Asn)/glutamyl-tRNA(Gln) amidotransferase subunit C [Pedobacter sp. CG_S7]|uniref:Asp-tRNA(Asn)/Glu-tRNA(Gln) amidotransferase subunit GatC n=1 Tax=Pedobacter sp. CG_S7 TaxID=3143930 RepID=UPI003397CA30